MGGEAEQKRKTLSRTREDYGDMVDRSRFVDGKKNSGILWRKSAGPRGRRREGLEVEASDFPGIEAKKAEER